MARQQRLPRDETAASYDPGPISRWLLPIALALLAGCGETGNSASADESCATGCPIKAAVLPFRPSSNDFEEITVADGIAEAIINEMSGTRLAPLRAWPILAASAGFEITSAAATAPFRQSTESPTAIAQALGVAYLIEGGVRFGNHNLRITSQITRAADSESLWSQTYERARDDPYTVQGELARRIAWQATIALARDRSSTQIRRSNPEAYAHFARALDTLLASLAGEVADLAAAARDFRRAGELDASHAPSHLGAIATSLLLAERWLQPTLSFDEIGALVNAAEIRPAAPPGAADMPIYATLPTLKAWLSLLSFDLPNAELFVREALAQNPNDAVAHEIDAKRHMLLDRSAQALASFQRAAVPMTNPELLVAYGNALMIEGDREHAFDSAARGFEFFPGSLGKARMLLLQADVRAAEGDLEEATTLVDRAWQLVGREQPERFPAALAMTGRTARALDILDTLEHQAATRIDPREMIHGYFRLNAPDDAYRWIDKSLDAHAFAVIYWLSIQTSNDQVDRDDPRWKQARERARALAGISITD